MQSALLFIFTGIILRNVLGNTPLKQSFISTRNSFVKQSNIALVTYFAPGTSYEARLEPMVSANKRAYAAANGYDFINAFEFDDIKKDYEEHLIMHYSPASHYFKLRLIPYLFRKYNYEWIMWCDGDAIFLNHSKKIEPYLDTNYDIILTSDPPANQKWFKVINTGNFFVKNSPWTIKFFYQAYGLSFANCMEYFEHRPIINGWLNICESRERHLLADQRVLQYYISYAPHELYGCHFKLVHFYNFNSEFPNYLPGDVVVHFPGRPMSDKVRLIKAMLESCDHSNGNVNFTKAPELKPNYDAIRYENSAFDSVNRKCVK